MKLSNPGFIVSDETFHKRTLLEPLIYRFRKTTALVRSGCDLCYFTIID